MTRAINVGSAEYSTLGVLFSVDTPTAVFCTEKCIKSIDDFFDSLKLDNTGTHTAPMVNFGDTFMYFDTNNRWAYKGSNSIPPCHDKWYKTISMTVYPIKQRHLDLYKKSQVARGVPDGNYRAIQATTDKHMV